MLSTSHTPFRLLDSPTRAQAALSLRQLRSEDLFLLHLVAWIATSILVFVVNLLTTGLNSLWSLWPFVSWGSLVLLHGYLGIVRGRRRYAREHALLDEAAQTALGAGGSPGSDLQARLIGLLTSAREALHSSAPEVQADLSRGEAHALTTLAWLKQAEGLMARGEASAELRQDTVDRLSQPGLGASRHALEALRNEIDLREAAQGALEREASRRQSILESFALALEGAVAARDREDLLAAVTGPIRDRVTLLESALAEGPSTPPAALPGAEASTQRIQEEVDLARQLQRSILPDEAPSVAGLSVAHLYQPSSEVGGDFYDFYSLGAERLLVAVGDASGHGLDSSMVSSMAKSALYTHVSSGRALDQTMVEMNRMMWDTLGRQRLMTLALLEIDVAARQLTWVNAGQVYPMLRRAGVVQELESPSYPLGVRRQASYEVQQHALEAGDVLVIFTDGYVEAIDPSGEPFGWSRMSERLRQFDGTNTDLVVSGLSEALHRHLGDTRPQDDVTLVAIGIEP